MESYLKFDKPLEKNYNAEEKVNWYYSAIRRYEEYKLLEGTIVVNEGTDEEYVFVPETKYGKFQIVSISREDFEDNGYDVSGLTDDDMKRIASKMGDNYLDQMFWIEMGFWAEEYHLPKK